MKSRIDTVLKNGMFLATCWLTAFSAEATAQATKIEGDFIFFVDGVNIKVPTVPGGTVIDDPAAPTTNKILRFANGNWTTGGFAWPNPVGVDMSNYTGTNYGETDTLFLKLRVDPANAGAALRLEWFDKSNGGAVGTDDLAFRMGWTVPEWAKNGAWHNLAIPLPVRTAAMLDSAKKGLKYDGTTLGATVDTLYKYWTYGGAWGNGAGVFERSNPAWAEWQWDGVQQVGFHWDVNGTTGPLWVDNFYIGGKSTNIAVATAEPNPVPAAQVSFANKEATISWTPSSNAGAYIVYYSDKPFTSVGDAGVVSLGQQVGTSMRHIPLAPHPSLAKAATSYYAVTSLNDFGKENSSIANSYKSIDGDLTSTAFMQEVDASVAEGILDDIDAGLVTKARFPTNVIPFEVTRLSRNTAGSATPENDADLSAKIWSVYFQGPTVGTYLILYAEVVDEFRQWTAFSNLTSAWNFDSIEMGFGGYTVNSFLVGSTHTGLERGAEPDYQFRFGKFSDQIKGYATESWRFNDIVPNTQSLVDSLRDGSNNVIGYKLLAAINLEALQGGTGNDALITLPTNSEIKLYPFTIAVNDADGNGRQAQLNWSYKPNTTDSWYNQPNQLPSVAFAGKNLIVSNDEEKGAIVNHFELLQNYPNPFNPSTSIQFSVPKAGAVQLEVFNLVGQKVATLVNGRISAGSHKVNFDASTLASGFYLYRLTSGGQTMSRKLMLIK